MKIDTCEELKSIIFNKVKLPSHTSSMYIDKDKKYVAKELIRCKDYDCHKRETYILKLLNDKNFVWCPKLIYSDNFFIVVIFF